MLRFQPIHARSPLVRPLGAVMLVAALLPACSRTDLFGYGSSGSGSGGSGSAGTLSSGTGGGPDAGRPPPPCYLSLVSPAAIPLISFPEGDTDGTAMVVLDPGQAAGSTTARPARIAYQAISEDANFWHPELRIGSIQVGVPWPDGVSIDKPPVLAGVDAHAWGEIAPGATGGIGLAWFRSDEAAGKPVGLKFRPIDTSSWALGPEVFLDPTGTVTYGFVAGAARAADGAGYGGQGYGLAYRGQFEVESSEPRFAVLDAAGAVVMGPLPFAALEAYPGRGGDVAWTGETYVVATVAGGCSVTGPPCVPNSVVVSRVRPPQVEGDSAILELGASIPISKPEDRPRRPVLASHDGTVWLAWSERESDQDAPPRTVHLARLDAGGNLVGGIETLAEGVSPTTGLSLMASDVGVVLLWGEDPNPDLPAGVPGHSRLVVHHRDRNGAPLDPPRFIETTAFAYNPSVTAVTLGHPRSVLVTWAGNEETEWETSITFLSRLDCNEAPVP